MVNDRPNRKDSSVYVQRKWESRIDRQPEGKHGYNNKLEMDNDLIGNPDLMLSYDSERADIKFSYDLDLNGNRTQMGIARAQGGPFLPVYDTSYL